MRVAVYGGSFNPPHVVHAMVASWLLWSGTVDEVWIVPVYRHAFETIQEKRLVDYASRMLWCQRMAETISPSIQVCDVESKLPVPSYSIDTLEYLASVYPEHQFRLVVGSDVVSQLPQWKNWQAIQAKFSPIIVGRVGFDGANQSMIFPNISSTGIREILRKGDMPTSWLLASVCAELEKHNPYRR